MEPLQQFDLGETRYERVNDRWVCGRTADGEPCPIGPDGHGHCQAHLACVPHRDGDSYVCPKHPSGRLVSPERRSWSENCPGPLPDGRCPMIGTPCQPARSLRARRHRVTLAVASVAFATALMLLGGSTAQRMISPGELTFQHHSSRHDCSACHSAGQGHLFDWAGTALTDPDSLALQESQHCQKCHELGEHALFPHGTEPQVLATVTDRIRNASRDEPRPWVFAAANVAGKLLPSQSVPMTCSDCHHEHRGNDFDLTLMTDHQCQSCHTGQFHSFSQGHPEFNRFPYQRRTRIHFDHSSHYGAHFADFQRIMPNGHQPASCLSCHEPDPSNKTMPVRGFAESCASCHGSQIENHRFPGIAAFALPKLDLDALRGAGRAIGEWPTGGTSGITELPPLMHLLLADDERLRPALQALEGIDLRDLTSFGDDADAANGRAKLVERFAWSIKFLLHDVVNEGPAGLEQRLARALGDRAPESEVGVLAGRAPAGLSMWDSLAAAQAVWFPNLAAEVQRQRQGERPDTAAIELKSADETARPPSGGWHWTESEPVITYHNTGHADPWLRAWLDVTVRFPLSLTNERDFATESHTVDPRLAAMQRLWIRLADPTSVHRCLDCHSVDRSAAGLQINWRGRHSHPADHFSVKFSHSPHVNLMKCQNCHKLDEEITFQHPQFWSFHGEPAISTNGQVVYTSGFDRVLKQQCVECHTTQRVGDNCLKCHNYHIGHFQTVRQ